MLPAVAVGLFERPRPPDGAAVRVVRRGGRHGRRAEAGPDRRGRRRRLRQEVRRRRHRPGHARAPVLPVGGGRLLRGPLRRRRVRDDGRSVVGVTGERVRRRVVAPHAAVPVHRHGDAGRVRGSDQREVSLQHALGHPALSPHPPRMRQTLFAHLSPHLFLDVGVFRHAINAVVGWLVWLT